MPEAKKVKNIVIHCSAGFGDRRAIEKFWYTPKPAGLGWKSPGYHILIDLEGNSYQLANFNSITNGVYGYNSETIHICYIGGVDRNDYSKAVDTRTIRQKIAIHEAIQDAIEWLKDNGKDITKDLGVVGHRDFSKDNNSNGVIESWERIKECPSFDAVKDYSYLYASKDRYHKLPTT